MLVKYILILWFFCGCCCFIRLSTVSLVKNLQLKDNILLWLTIRHGSSTLLMGQQTLYIS